MQLRSGVRRSKAKMHDDHDILYENTIQELLDMYPQMSLKQIKTLKTMQDTVVQHKFTVLDILGLDCTDKKKEKVY